MTEQCKHKYRGHYAELVYEESPPEVKRNPPMIYICEYCKEVLDWKEVVQMLNEYETLKAATERLKEYAVLLDGWFVADELPLNATRAIGAARANCANILEGK